MGEMNITAKAKFEEKYCGECFFKRYFGSETMPKCSGFPNESEEVMLWERCTEIRLVLNGY